MENKFLDKDKQIGVLLTNLGTPESPTSKDLKKYLNEFLMDERVVDLPRIFWVPLLKLIILNVRPKKSAKLYKKIWTDKGSPLLNISQRQLDGVQKIISNKYPNVQFALGMRYGNPSIEKALKELQE